MLGLLPRGLRQKVEQLLRQVGHDLPPHCRRGRGRGRGRSGPEAGRKGVSRGELRTLLAVGRKDAQMAEVGVVVVIV